MSIGLAIWSVWRDVVRSEGLEEGSGVGGQDSEDRLRIEKGRKAQENSLKSLKPLKPFKSQAKLAPTGHCENKLRAES